MLLACQFVLGFAALRAMIPGVVGDCLEDERHNAFNGDGLQRTTGGLMVWRKADNFTAFTDGHWTWVNGPYGLQRRLNSERFEWEARLGPEQQAVEAAARVLGVAPDALRVVRVEAVEWSDASLGCPQPGMMYAQVITPGYRVLVELGGRQRELHTDTRGRAVVCS